HQGPPRARRAARLADRRSAARGPCPIGPTCPTSTPREERPPTRQLFQESASSSRSPAPVRYAPPPGTRCSEMNRGSERSEESDQVLRLFCVQSKLQHQVEIPHRIVEREAAPIVQVGRRVLDPAEREHLDRAVVSCSGVICASSSEVTP